MVKTLEYRSVESDMHGITGLEIQTPEQFIHHVASRPGPVLDDLNSKSAKMKVLLSERNRQHIPVLGFNFAAMGQGYSGQPVDRAARAMAIVSQIEQVAAVEGVSDSRFHLSGARTPWDNFDRGPLEVSFEPATADPEELAERIQEGMLRAARNLRLHSRQDDDRRFIHVNTVGDGRALTIRADHINENPVLFRGRFVETGSGAVPRVVLQGSRDRVTDLKRMRHARLVAVAGIVSTLRPLE